MARRGKNVSGNVMSRQFKTPIAVRAYSERPDRKPLGSRPSSKEAAVTEWMLVFDCETTVDADQQLRFGFFQIRRGDVLDREGVFFDATTVTEVDEALLLAYTQSKKLELMTVSKFRTDIFMKYGYVRRE